MYCYINDTKMTKTEWEATHTADYMDEDGYIYCDTYEAYCAEFDKWMAMLIETRDYLRKTYVELMKAEFTDAWAESFSDFCENFKDCYGRSPWFADDMLIAKGITRDDLRKAWKRMGA